MERHRLVLVLALVLLAGCIRVPHGLYPVDGWWVTYWSAENQTIERLGLPMHALAPSPETGISGGHTIFLEEGQDFVVRINGTMNSFVLLHLFGDIAAEGLLIDQPWNGTPMRDETYPLHFSKGENRLHFVAGPLAAKHWAPEGIIDAHRVPVALSIAIEPRLE